MDVRVSRHVPARRVHPRHVDELDDEPLGVGRRCPRRVEDLITQRAQDHIRALRHEEHLARALDATYGRPENRNPSASRLPQTRNGTQQARLAAATGAHDQQRRSPLDVHVQTPDEHPVGLAGLVGAPRRHFEVERLDHQEVRQPARRLNPLDRVVRLVDALGRPSLLAESSPPVHAAAAAAAAANIASAAIKHLAQLPQPINHGAEASQRLELEHHQRDVSQDVVERRRALVDHPKLDVSLEVKRSDDCCRQNLDQEPVERGEEVQPPRRDQQVPVVLHDRLQPVPQQRPLLLFSSVERNGLGVLPHAHQPVPEVGLGRLLQEVEPDQRPTDVDARKRSPDRVHEQRHEQRRVDGKQDAGETNQVHRRVEQRHRQRERRPCELRHVARDTLVRVVQLRRRLQRIKLPIFEVLIHQIVRHPLPPVQRQLGLVVVPHDKHGNTEHQRPQPLEQHL